MSSPWGSRLSPVPHKNKLNVESLVHRVDQTRLPAQVDSFVGCSFHCALHPPAVFKNLGLEVLRLFRPCTHTHLLRTVIANSDVECILRAKDNPVIPDRIELKSRPEQESKRNFSIALVRCKIDFPDRLREPYRRLTSKRGPQV